MKRKILSSLLCLLLVISMSLIASAVLTPATTANYKRNYNYKDFTTIPDSRKTTSLLGNQIYAYNKTSWTWPKAGIVDTSKTSMTVISTITNKSSSALWFTSMAEMGKYHNVVIVGAASQVGTDTMTVRYNLDTDEAPPVAR